MAVCENMPPFFYYNMGAKRPQKTKEKITKIKSNKSNGHINQICARNPKCKTHKAEFQQFGKIVKSQDTRSDKIVIRFHKFPITFDSCFEFQRTLTQNFQSFLIHVLSFKIT